VCWPTHSFNSVPRVWYGGAFSQAQHNSEPHDGGLYSGIIDCLVYPVFSHLFSLPDTKP